jgi:hypothetical protein
MAAKKAKKTGAKKPRDPVGSFNFGLNKKPRKKTGIRYDKFGNAYGS